MSEEKPSKSLEAKVNRLEKEVKQMKSFFGQLGDTHVEGACDKCDEPGTVTKTDKFSGREYVYYKDKNGHEWFEDKPTSSP